MNPTRALPLATTPLAALIACLVAAAAPLQAQTVYRIVGPDGRVTFSDKPARDAAAKPAASSAAPNAPANPSTAATLPYALRQIMAQHPVTLYTGADCAPCDTGRALLKGRGVPFAEKTISSNEDIEALKRLSGDTSLPVLALGGQKIRGLSETQWAQYLDTAGYPKKSALPASYRFTAASPLVTLPKPAPETPPAKPEVKTDSGNEGQAPKAPLSTRNPNNPAGISF